MENLSMLMGRKKGGKNSKSQTTGPEGQTGYLALASHMTEVFHPMFQK